MSDLLIEMVCTIKIGPDAQKNVQAMNAMLESSFRVRNINESEIVLEKIVGGDEFIALLHNKPIVDLVTDLRTPKPIDVPREKRTYKKRMVQPTAASEPEDLALKKARQSCALCPNLIRVDNKPCPGCNRKVCTKCGVFSNGIKRCRPCATATKTKSRPRASRPRQYSTKKSEDFKPVAGTDCESCTKFKAVIKCAGCAKMVCGFCARRYNGQCKDCASVPA